MADSESIGNVPDGIYLRTPISEATLAEAYGQVEDPSFWDDSMPLILFHFSVSDYWSLTVVEHRRLWDFLVKQGLVDASL